ncbi:hypothetical protein [Alloprevotella tannerae]|nr:hypothetical protein [Alloprevotella tannerae]
METLAIRMTVTRSGNIALLLLHSDKKIARRAFDSTDYNNLQYQ